MTFEIADLDFKAEPTMREHGEPGTFTLVHRDAEWYAMYRFGIEGYELYDIFAADIAGRHFSTVRVMGPYPWFQYVEYRRGGMDI